MLYRLYLKSTPRLEDGGRAGPSIWPTATAHPHASAVDASSSANEGDQAEEADGDGAPAASYLGEANKPARAGDVAIAVRQENPKRLGSQSHARYEKYKAATTLSEFRSLGGSARTLDKTSSMASYDAAGDARATTTRERRAMTRA